MNTSYSNKEIFLCGFNRYPTSTASDTVDKIRYKSQMEPEKMQALLSFYIKIIPDKTNPH